MPITIKTGPLKFKDPDTGQYVGIDVVAETKASQQLASIEAAGEAQVASITQNGEAQMADITENGTTQMTNITQNGQAQVAAIQATGQTQVSNIETKGADTLDSIPDDYTDLYNEVGELKSHVSEIDSALFDNDVMQPIDVSAKGTLMDKKGVDESGSSDTGIRIVNKAGRALCYFPPAEKAGKINAKSIDTTHSITVYVTTLENPVITPATGGTTYPIIGGYTSTETILGEDITVQSGQTVIVTYNRSYNFVISGNIFISRDIISNDVIEQVQAGFIYDETPTAESANAISSGAMYETLKGYVHTSVVGTGKNKFNKNDSDNQPGKVLDGTTGETSNNNAYYTSYFIPVSPLKPYTLYNPNSGRTGSRAYAFYDDQKVYISGSTGSSYTTIGTSPENAAYIRFCITNGNEGIVMLLEGLYYNNVPYEDYNEIREISGSPIIPEELDPFFIKKSSNHNQYNPNGILLNSAINNDGYRVYNSTYFTSNIVYCGGYDVLVIAFEIQDGQTASSSAMNPRNIAFYDKAMEPLSVISSGYTYIWDINGFAYTRVSIPTGAYFAIVGYGSDNTTIRRMIYCANGANAFPIYKYDDYNESFVIRNDVVKEKSYVDSPFNGKTLNVIGDSITYGFGTYATLQKAFPYLTGYNLNMVVNNYGINSSEIAERSAGDDSHDPMCIRYADMVDADVIVVAGGTNDWEHAAVTLGQMGDTSINTFYGALDTMCKGLIQKYPDKIIIFMTPIKRSTYYTPNSLGYIQEQFADAIKEVCAFYGIPVLDMFEKCTINPTIEVNRAKWLVDNTHPNQAGHVYMASMLIGFIASLVQSTAN